MVVNLLSIPQVRVNSGRLGETVRDWGDYRDQGDQGRCRAGRGNSGRLGETVRDWGDYRVQGDQSRER